MLNSVLACFVSLLLQNQNDAAGNPVDKGVIHEAYAQITQGAPPTDNLLIPRQPPEPLAEEPPDTRPDGDSVTWISGYWHYDDLRDDFIWVSGFWRQVPPGRKWVPGRFLRANLANRWQWQAGFWGPADPVDPVVVQDMPPPVPEAGPSVPAPAANMFWSPGYQAWRVNRWVWRSGCWMSSRPGWVWYPSSWCWTPRGYRFLPGYWDYALEYRGLLYAPVYYRPAVWQVNGFRHRPRYLVCHDDLACGMFRRNGCGNYYYGDYFGVQLAGLGFNFWIGGGNVGPARLDPLAGYYHRHRDAGWVRGVEQYGLQRARGNIVQPPANIVLAENKTLVSVVNTTVKNTTINNNSNNKNAVNNSNNSLNKGEGKGPQPPARKEAVRLVQAGSIPKVDLKTTHGLPPREVDHATLDMLKKDGKGPGSSKTEGVVGGRDGRPGNGTGKLEGVSNAAGGASREPGAKKGPGNVGTREITGKDLPKTPLKDGAPLEVKKDTKGGVSGNEKMNGARGQDVAQPTVRETKLNPPVETPKVQGKPVEPAKMNEPRQRTPRNNESGKAGGSAQETQIPAVLRGGGENRGTGKPGTMSLPGGVNLPPPQVGTATNPGRGSGNGGSRGTLNGSTGSESRRVPDRTKKEEGKQGSSSSQGRSGNG